MICLCVVLGCCISLHAVVDIRFLHLNIYGVSPDVIVENSCEDFIWRGFISLC